jgi:hypothetical protein
VLELDGSPSSKTLLSNTLGKTCKTLKMVPILATECNNRVYTALSDVDIFSSLLAVQEPGIMTADRTMSMIRFLTKGIEEAYRGEYSKLTLIAHLQG